MIFRNLLEEIHKIMYKNYIQFQGKKKNGSKLNI